MEELFEQIRKEFKQESFIFDIYIEKKPQSPQNRVWLIDLNPWREFTNPLMFTFEELEEITDNQFHLKVIPNLKETIV